ncbi:MAG: glycosyltransferase [Bacteroidales bacterium]
MDLSIVIPVYNEQEKIRQDLIAASDYLYSRKMRGEIIVADDGSTDQTSEVVAATKIHEGVSLQIINNKVHTGKGHAVKNGILQARADLIMFIDSGNCVPFDNIDRGIELLNSNTCLIAHGSRYHPDSIIKRSNNPFRRIISYLFRRLITFIVHIPDDLKDTQCGLKIYRKHVAHELYAECLTDGFMFDIEIILRARKHAYSIREFPIDWTSDPDSRLSVRRSLFKMFTELLGIRRTLKN